jgi:Reverse transcriptase (RNA-dependent DNA polymerase)
MLGDDVKKGSRRWFLRLTAGLGAGVAYAPRVMADAGHGELRLDDALPPHLAGSANPAEVSAAIDLALENIAIEGIDQFFPAPFELERLRGSSTLRDRVARRIAENLLHLTEADSPLPIEAVPVPKLSAHAYRRAGWIEPVDLLTFLTCAILIAYRIEPTRVPVGAQRVFSHRFNPRDGRLFDAQYDGNSFHAAVARRLEARAGTVLVSADVSECYDSIFGDRLAQSLLRRGVETWLVATVSRLLAGWRGNVGRGLPIGSHASRILAEAILGDIDSYLQADGIDYVRFIDDYRLFAPDAATAQAWLQRVDERLTSEGLCLNQSKTSIRSLTGEQYETLGQIRRAGLLWGKLGRDRILRVAQGTPPSPPIGAPPAPPDSPSGSDGTTQPKLTVPDHVRDQESSVVLRYHKTPLQQGDAELVRSVDATALLSDLKHRAARDAYIPIGDLRLLVEATLAARDYTRFAEIFDLLAVIPRGAIFMADVLETCRDEIPKPVRSAATQWYAARLLEGAFPAKFEALQAVLLLGANGYEAPQVLREYLEAKAPASPLMQRTLLEGLRNHCDKDLAQALLAHCDRVAPQTRRVLLDVVWPHLEAAQRSVLARRYAEEAQRDPFVAALFEAAGTGDTAIRAQA